MTDQTKRYVSPTVETLDATTIVESLGPVSAGSRLGNPDPTPIRVRD